MIVMADLIGLLKKEMGYTNKEVRCGLCDHFIETTKGRGEMLCKLNGAVPIEVDPEGRCDFYKCIDAIKIKI